MKITLVSIWLLACGIAFSTPVIVADTKHNQVEQAEEGSTALREDIAVTVTETSDLRVDFSKLPAEKLNELADANVIHVSTPAQEQFTVEWDPKTPTITLSPKTLKSRAPGKQFAGFKEGTYVLAAGTLTEKGFSVPWCILLKVVNEKTGRTEQGGTGQPATRSQSKSEGSEKPQPESEGRSR
jgi:hypothetical protein